MRKLAGWVLTAFFVLSVVVVIVPQNAKADTPIQDMMLSFSSLEDLNSFYMDKTFGVINYKDGSWQIGVEIDKNSIVNFGHYYVIAPYQYMDSSGYPHIIIKRGCYISISNIAENITIIITGFTKATVVVKNFGGTLVLGKTVVLAKKVKAEQTSLLDWSNLIPGWDIYVNYQKLAALMTSVQETHPATYSGLYDSTVSVSNGNCVIFNNFFISSPISMPVYINNARYVELNGVYITPSKYTQITGSGISLESVDNVVICGMNKIARYQYDIEMKNIKNIVLKGNLTLNGAYTDPKMGIHLNYGTGIYAENINHTIFGKMDIDATIGSGGYSSIVFAHATGNYNESNGTFWGHIDAFDYFVYSTSIAFNGISFTQVVDSFTVRVVDDIPIVQKLNLSGTNQTVDMSGVGWRDYEVRGGVANTTLKIHAKYTNFTVLRNTTGIVEIITNGNNTTYINHRNMNLTLCGSLFNGSWFSGTLPPGKILLQNLSVGLGVADDGAAEQELVNYINGTGGVNVDTLISYNTGYVGSYEQFDVPLVFGGFAAIVGLLVSVGWMRIGIMLSSLNQQKKAEAKEMIFRAAVGTIIVAMVLFGWANLMGLANWVFGG